MLTKKLLASLSLFLIFCAVYCNEQKSCIDAPPVMNFKPDKYFGHYYGQAFEGESPKGIDCLHYLISEHKKCDIYPLVQIYRDKSDNSKHMVLQNFMMDSQGRGMNVKNQPLIVVGTDYYNYLVEFSCDESTNTRTVAVLTASASLGLTDLIIPQGLLQQFNISLYEDSTFMNQKDCPVDWSDAEVDEVDFTYDLVEEELIEYNITRGRNIQPARHH